MSHDVMLGWQAKVSAIRLALACDLRLCNAGLAHKHIETERSLHKAIHSSRSELHAEGSFTVTLAEHVNVNEQQHESLKRLVRIAQRTIEVGSAPDVSASACHSCCEANPVSKVVDLLTDLQAKITKEGEAELKAFEEYTKWCDDTTQELGAELALLQKACIPSARLGWIALYVTI
eukprot:3749812-Amphidinium_carterae.2